MGLQQTNISEDDDDYEDDSPVVETGYYWGELKSVHYYPKDGEQKIVLQFEIEDEVDGETVSVEVPYFAFAKVSCYGAKDVDFASSSNLGKVLEDLGGVQVFDEYVGADGAISSGDAKYEVELDNESEQDEFRNGLKAAMAGKRYKLNVKKTEQENDDGETEYSNIVAEIEEVEEVDQSSSDEDDSVDVDVEDEAAGDDEDGEKDVLFDEEDEDGEDDELFEEDNENQGSGGEEGAGSS